MFETIFSWIVENPWLSVLIFLFSILPALVYLALIALPNFSFWYKEASFWCFPLGLIWLVFCHCPLFNLLAVGCAFEETETIGKRNSKDYKFNIDEHNYEFYFGLKAINNYKLALLALPVLTLLVPFFL